jgi:hypothetical protein
LAERVIVYWRDIPAQVIVKAGRRAVAKRELPERFVQAIDASAMRTGARDTDAYLAEWRRGAPEPCGDDLEAEADAALARLAGGSGHPTRSGSGRSATPASSSASIRSSRRSSCISTRSGNSSAMAAPSRRSNSSSGG